jgi:hypothetical protein
MHVRGFSLPPTGGLGFRRGPVSLRGEGGVFGGPRAGTGYAAVASPVVVGVTRQYTEITVVGEDKTGLIARVTTLLFERDINIEDLD